MSEKKMTSIGGQAVIEGVMMRGPFKTCVTVRKPNGEIVEKITDNKVKGGFRRIPILRGIFGFVNSMVIGVNALMFSAQFYEDDGTPKEEATEEPKSVEESSEENTKKKARKATKDEEKGGELSGFALFLTLLSSIALSVGLFIVLPNVVAGLIVPGEPEAAIVSGDTVATTVGLQESGEVVAATVTTPTSGEAILQTNTETTKRNVVLYNLVESIVKVVIFLGYLILVSQLKDIKRVFEYHGAEHKSIFCYEHGEELTVENVKKYQRFHPRCGTSFLLFVIIISIIVYSIVGRHPVMILNVLIRIALLPLIAGVSYEIIRFAGKHVDSPWISWLSQPGMWLQRLTTREPDDSQIECAINSLKKVIPEDGKSDLW